MLEKSAAIEDKEQQTKDHPLSKFKRVFQYRDFRLLWTGAFLSFCGSWIQTVAQQVLVYDMTRSY